MFRISNNLVGILNILVFACSIPILITGIWLGHHGNTDCEKFLVKPVIIMGTFLLLVSLAGLIGACCRVTWLLWIYLAVMFLLIVALFCLTIFTFVVTNKGAGEVLSNRGYKQYRLGDYSHWLQKRVENDQNWWKIKSCLMEGRVCQVYNHTYFHDDAQTFYSRKLNSLQSGCCKPSDECDYRYVSPTNWTKQQTSASTEPDCKVWDNDPKVLCYDCKSCKAGILDSLKGHWKKMAIVNIICLVILIVVYSLGCCAFRNNREDNAYTKWRGYPAA